MAQLAAFPDPLKKDTLEHAAPAAQRKVPDIQATVSGQTKVALVNKKDANNALPCRICLNHNRPTIPIDTKINQGTGPMSIVSIIRKLNKDKVVDGALDNLDLPQQICVTCMSRTSEAFLLMEEMSKSHQHFLSTLSEPSDLIDREGNPKVVPIIRTDQNLRGQPVLTGGEIHCIECNEKFPAESILAHFVAGRCKLTLESNTREVRIDSFDRKKTIACRNCEKILFKCDISKRSAICANKMPAQAKPEIKIVGNIPAVIDLTDVDQGSELNTPKENTSKQNEGNNNGSSTDFIKMSRIKSVPGPLKVSHPAETRPKLQTTSGERTANTNILGNQVSNAAVQPKHVQSRTHSEQTESRKRKLETDNACQMPDKTGKPA